MDGLPGRASLRSAGLPHFRVLDQHCMPLDSRRPQWGKAGSTGRFGRGLGARSAFGHSSRNYETQLRYASATSSTLTVSARPSTRWTDGVNGAPETAGIPKTRPTACPATAMRRTTLHASGVYPPTNIIDLEPLQVPRFGDRPSVLSRPVCTGPDVLPESDKSGLSTDRLMPHSLDFSIPLRRFLDSSQISRKHVNTVRRVMRSVPCLTARD